MKKDNKITPKSQNKGGFQPAEEGQENLAPTNETSTVQTAVTEEGRENLAPTNETSPVQTAVTEEGRENLAPTNETSPVQTAVITEGFNPPLLKTDDSASTVTLITKDDNIQIITEGLNPLLLSHLNTIEEQSSLVISEKANKQFIHVIWGTYCSHIKNIQFIHDEIKENIDGIILSKEERISIYNILSEKIKKENYDLIAINVLNNHVHCLIYCSLAEVFEIVKKLKGYSSFIFNNKLNNSKIGNNKLWAKGFYKIGIENLTYLENTIKYIKNNHIKHNIEHIFSDVQNAVTEEGRENLAPANETSTVQTAVTEEGRENLAPTNETSPVQTAVITEGFNPPLLKTDDSASQNDDSLSQNDDSASTVTLITKDDNIQIITEGLNPLLLSHLNTIEEQSSLVISEKANKQFIHVIWGTYCSHLKNTQFIHDEIKENIDGIILSKEERIIIYHILSEKIKKENYDLIAINILNNHVHCLIYCSLAEVFEIVKKLKGYSSFIFNNKLNNSKTGNNKLWAKGFYKIGIENLTYLENTIKYIKNNHIKHNIEHIFSDVQNAVTEEGRENLAPANETSPVQTAVITPLLQTDDSLSRNDDSLSQNDDSLSRNDDSLSQNDDSLSRNDDSLSRNDDSASRNDDSASQNDENSTVQNAVITEGFNPPLLKDDDSLLKDGDSTLNNKGQ